MAQAQTAKTLSLATDYVNAYTDLGKAIGPLFTDAKIRELVRGRHENGLEKYCRVVGRQVLISVSGFWQWIHEEHDGRKRPHQGGRLSRTAHRR